jgi:hypothetical protein
MAAFGSGVRSADPQTQLAAARLRRARRDLDASRQPLLDEVPSSRSLHRLPAHPLEAGLLNDGQGRQ